jgi:hypothetical protein
MDASERERAALKDLGERLCGAEYIDDLPEAFYGS